MFTHGVRRAHAQNAPEDNRRGPGREAGREGKRGDVGEGFHVALMPGGDHAG